ncbi:Alpha-factor-transporting ATPase [Cyberlindnera fabianii]|uniref:Alpha-factor-transporting ATPase n=1 Tax=Cyberlindnera fabianii TaxID=36022 RepID=A0A1V2L8E8_CYBFA|nr:Alpha-factor-transporting ATPase [Cyberlindnera fabianii]
MSCPGTGLQLSEQTLDPKMLASSPTTIATDSTLGLSNYEDIKGNSLFDLDVQNDAADNVKDESYYARVRKAKLFMLFEKSDSLLLFSGIVATVLGALGPPISSILMGRVFDVLSNYLKGKYSSKSEFMHSITLSTMALPALGAGSIIVVWATITCWMLFGERQALRARQHMLTTFLTKPISWYEGNDKVMGDLTQTNRCIEEVRSGCAEASALTLQSIISAIALFGTSMYYSWSVTLVTLCTTPLIAVMVFFFTRWVEKYAKLENDETTEAAKILDFSLVSAKQVRLFSTQGYETSKFVSAVTRCKDVFIKLSIISAANVGSLRFIVLCMFVQGFWFGSHQVRKGNASPGDVLTCFTSCLMVGEVLKSCFPQILTIQTANVAMTKIQNFIQLRKITTVKSKFTKNFNVEDAKNISLYPETCSGDIKFKNITFAYPTRPDTKVLNNVSVHFPAGKTTFLVGRSGSGKSTLGSLLLNFYTPSKGRVEIDGFAVNDVSSRWLTDNITLVEQTCTLFKDTIRNNILMGCVSSGTENVANSDLEEAVQMSLLQEVVRDLDNGLDTVVGPNGITLSGGQQQRVAIARARLRDTPILILDESVSALDIVMRDLMIAAIKKWRQGKTTVILTHEFSQIGDTDYVYLMENGVIAEQGCRRDLSGDGLFNRLASMQGTSSDDVDDIELDVKQFEKAVERSFLNKVGSRISTQFFSTVNPLSHFQNQEFNFEVDEGLFMRPVTRRAKRAPNAEVTGVIADDKSLSGKDVEKGIIDDDNERPELTPILQIVKHMMKTVEKKGVLAFGLFMTVLNGGVSPAFSFCFSKLLSGIVPQNDDVGSNHYLVKWSVIVLAMALADGATLFFKDFTLHYSSELWIFGLRNKAFRKITEQGLTWFSIKTNSASEVSALLMNDARDLRSLVSHFLSVVTTVIILGSTGLIWAFIEGWKLSLVCVSMLPAFVLTSGLYAGLLQSSENNYKNAVADLENQLYETARGFKTIRTLRLESYFDQKYQERVDVLKKAAMKRAIFTGMGVAVTNMLTFVVEGILLYYGMKLVGDKEYETSKVMETYVLLIFSIMSCVQLMSEVPDISRGQRAGTYTFRILDLMPDEVESRGSLLPKIKPSEIVRFESCFFSYPSLPNQKVLNNVNFCLKRGEHVAVIGESGSGKSTLTLLITRLFLTAAQTVFYEGVDVNDIDVHFLRSKVAMVDQTANFFDGTIRENLLYGMGVDVDDDEIYSTLKLANIYDFVISLPEGLESRIDTQLMSGGQAQRLSIARALIRKPDLLILDECTSALDAESTQKIAQLVGENLKDSEMSILMITHSQEMMTISDRVVVMRAGTVAEEGRYEQLYASRGELFRIVTAGCADGLS